MKIDGDRFLEVLCLPSYDEKVLSLLKDLRLKRPMKDEDYNYVCISRETDDEKVEIDFTEELRTIKQKQGFYKNVDFFVADISIQRDEKYSLPFGILWDDSYEKVKEKIGKKADFKIENGRNRRKIWMLKDEDKEYLLNINFYDDYKEIKFFLLGAYDNDVKYLMPKNEE